MAEGIRLLATGAGALALFVPQAQVQMHARAGQVAAPLGHKGDGEPLAPGDLFKALFVDGVAVGHREDLRVAPVEFVLAGASAIGIGTALFYDPLICPDINQGIDEYLNRHGYSRVAEIVGSLDFHASNPTG